MIDAAETEESRDRRNTAARGEVLARSLLRAGARYAAQTNPRRFARTASEDAVRAPADRPVRRQPHHDPAGAERTRKRRIDFPRAWQGHLRVEAEGLPGPDASAKL